MRNPIRPHVALGALGLNKEYVLRGDSSRWDLTQPADDPAHGVLVLFQRARRPAELHLAVAKKIRHELADRRLPFAFCREGRAYGCRRNRHDRAGGVIGKHKTATPKRKVTVVCFSLP